MTLNEVCSNVRSLYDDWTRVLANPNYLRGDFCLSWPEFRKIRFGDNLTDENVAELVAQRQFSFQLAIDGSPIQLYYQFDRHQLISASLAFYQHTRSVEWPPTDLEGDASQQELTPVEDDATTEAIALAPVREERSSEMAPDQIDIESDNSFPLFEADDFTPLVDTTQSDSRLACWIRLDYSPNDERGILHGASHLHLSLMPHTRIPVVGVPTPKQFVEAVLAWFYPAMYSKFHLKADGSYHVPTRTTKINEEKISVTVNPLLSQILHIGVPGTR